MTWKNNIKINFQFDMCAYKLFIIKEKWQIFYAAREVYDVHILKHAQEKKILPQHLIDTKE